MVMFGAERKTQSSIVLWLTNAFVLEYNKIHLSYIILPIKTFIPQCLFAGFQEEPEDQLCAAWFSEKCV